MIRVSRTDEYDVELYAERLRKKGFLYFDKKKLRMYNNYMRANVRTYQQLALNCMGWRSGMRQLNLTRDGISRYLIQSEHCPERYFYTKKAQGISISVKDVLRKVYANGYGKDFLDLYIPYTSMKSKCEKMDSIISKCCERAGENQEGAELYKLPFEVNPQVNLRFNYKNFDVIAQVPKDIASIYSVPKGYCLAWGDFAQSDFRIAYNLFLRSPENDAIMNKYEDKYEALARIVANAMGTYFNYEEFKKERQLYKVWILSTMYGTRNSVVPAEAKIIATLTDFLMKCPKYAEYVARLNVRAELGLPIVVTSYFGHEESIASFSDKDTMVNTALNSPIQTGTAEVMIITVNRILDDFYARGWTEDDIGVYLVRHDEPIFWMKEEVLKDAWIFTQYNKIFVDDWTPLQLDFQYGYSYKITDKNLEARAKDSVADNFDKIDLLSSGDRIVSDYYPVPNSLELMVAWKPVHDKTMVVFYDQKKNQASFMCIDTVDEKQVVFAIRSKLKSKSESITEAGYSGIVVKTTSVNSEDRFGRQYVRYKIDGTSRMDPAFILCRYMICKYCKNAGIASPVDPPYERDAVWIRQVHDLEIFR